MCYFSIYTDLEESSSSLQMSLSVQEDVKRKIDELVSVELRYL